MQIIARVDGILLGKVIYAKALVTGGILLIAKLVLLVLY